MQTKDDIKNLDDIKLFVNEFYLKVQANELLNPIFISRNKGDWQPHLDRMYLFWNAAIFGEKGYIGNPFSKHIGLNVTTVHFETWLQLFTQTINENFEGELAENAKWRAHIMADTFIRRLNNITQTGIIPIV